MPRAKQRRWLLYRILRVAAWLLRGPFTAGSCAVVLAPGHRVLLVQSRWRGRGWGLPGGFLKRGESPEEALRRELAEEIGLEGPYEAVPVDQYKQDAASHLEFLYCVHLDGGFEATVHDRKEVRRGRWFPLDDLPELLPEAEQALRTARRHGVLAG